MSLSRESSNAEYRIPTFSAIVFLSILSCAGYASARTSLLFAPICLSTYFFIFLTQTSDRVMDYSLGLWLATNLFVMSEFLLLSRTPPMRQRQLQELTLAKRWKSGFDLFVAARGPGIDGQGSPHQDSHLKPSQKAVTSRFRGVLKQLGTLAQCLAHYTIGDVAMQCNPSFETKGPAFYAQPWWLQPTVLGHTLTSWATINGSYCIAAIISITLGLSGPDEWPPMFGSLMDACTVHDSWRKVWHQMMRRFLTRHTVAFIQLARLRNRKVQWIVKLFLAFLISALIHFLGDYALLRDWAGGSMKFFMLQPVAIVLEQCVIALWQITAVRTPPSVARVVGYLWVLCWFTVTMPIWIEPVVRDGFLEDGWHFPIVFTAGKAARKYLGVS
ncbi:hypothetical protein NMY22_g18295 [Coprinellus aureogranulatus]|nr:hypothetical protein NMY22_g18295 [Coprinellus aureogranulatus]